MATALLVIDMQNDYLWGKRKKMFSYDTQALTAAVNELARLYDRAGCDVVYVRHVIQDLPTNRLLFGYSIAGTEGAELYGGLEVVSSHCFDKLVGDALSSRELREFLKSRGCDTVHLCGLDECGCVTATALGAARRGLGAAIVRDGTATVFSEKKVLKAHEKLRKAGIGFIHSLDIDMQSPRS